MYVRVCLSVYLFVYLCLSALIQLIIRKHIKVVIDDLFALLAAFLKQTCYFYYFIYFLYMLFVENKFFFFKCAPHPICMYFYPKKWLQIGKGKTRISVTQMCLIAVGTHMPYGITYCCLPPDRGDISAFTPTISKLVLDSTTLEGCKVKLT